MPLPPISVCSLSLSLSLSLSRARTRALFLRARFAVRATRRVASHDIARRRDLTKVAAFKLASCRRGDAPAFLFLDELVIILTRQVNPPGALAVAAASSSRALTNQRATLNFILTFVVAQSHRGHGGRGREEEGKRKGLGPSRN